MSDLRLFLLLSGILLIAAIYLWAVFQNRQQKRQQTLRDFPSAEQAADIRLNSSSDEGIDYNSTLAGLSRSMSGAREEKIEADLKVKDGAAEDPIGLPGQTKTQDLKDVTEQNNAVEESVEKGLQQGTVEEEPGVAPSAVTKIIAFNIIPRAKEYFAGEAIMKSLLEVDMHLGEMDIFHHFGVGDMKMEKPLFSLANILEPGNFSMDDMTDFRTPGLVMFMCLPAPIDAEVVFELMLNTAQRLADSLGADVCDAKRELLNEAGIDTIRKDLLETRKQ